MLQASSYLYFQLPAASGSEETHNVIDRTRLFLMVNLNRFSMCSIGLRIILGPSTPEHCILP